MAPSLSKSWCICSKGAGVDDILDRYGELLGEVDDWFASCILSHREQIFCRPGCSACCRGLFDITLLDALYVRKGFEQLAAPLKELSRRTAQNRLDILKESSPVLGSTWLLNDVPERDWQSIMPEDDHTPCPLLGSDGHCLVYRYRPMTCRLNGIPLFDHNGEELSDEWCTRNFREMNPGILPEIRHYFKDLFAQELLLFRALTKRLTGSPRNELDTLIPAAICVDWERLYLPR